MSHYYMLDTNAVSHIVRRTSLTVRAKLAMLAEHDIACVSAVSEGELRYGLATATGTHRI